MKPRETTRYSEAFKRQVISEIESGRFAGPHAAARAYRIAGSTTVTGWLRKYARSDLLPKRVTITTMAQEDEKKALHKRVRELERALADTHMKGLLADAYLQIACERLGEDVAEFKKKAATAPSTKPGERAR